MPQLAKSAVEDFTLQEVSAFLDEAHQYISMVQHKLDEARSVLGVMQQQIIDTDKKKP